MNTRMKWKKQAISLLLTGCLTVSVIPAAAFATDIGIMQMAADSTTVSSAEELAKALATKESNGYDNTKVKVDNTTVTLLSDEITISKALEINGSITLDLNGKTLKAENSSSPSAFTVGNRGTLTIIDSDSGDKGNITSDKDANVIIVSSGGKLNVENGTIKSTESSNTSSNISVVKVDGGTLNVSGGTIDGGNNTAVGVFTGAEVAVSGGTIKSTNEFALGTNGSAGQTNQKINISGGTITSENSAGVYLPSGEMTVTNGTITGKAGIVVRGGTLDVKGGNIEATGTDGNLKVGDDASHSVQESGIAVEKNANYGDSTVTIENGNITAKDSTKGGAVTYSEDGTKKTENAPIDITGGTFETGEDGKADENIKSFLNPSTELDKETGEVKALTEGVASIGNRYYPTLEDAISEVKNGETIQLQDKISVTASGGIKVNKDGVNFTLDLNGKEITNAKEAASGEVTPLFTLEGGNMTITDSSNGSGKITSVVEGNIIVINKGSGASTSPKLTINGGTIQNTYAGEDKGNSPAIYVKEGELTVSGKGVIDGGQDAAVFAKGDTEKTNTVTIADNAVLKSNNSWAIGTGGNSASSDTINITGGTITSTSENGSAVYLPHGKMNVSGGTIEGKAGIVVRGGELNVTGGKVIANGDKDTKVTVGDAKKDGKAVELPPAAVVVDKENGYGNGSAGKAAINGGEFIAGEDQDAVVFTSEGTKSTDSSTVGTNLVVSSGKFSDQVDHVYLDKSLNYEVTNPSEDEVPYSYYSSKLDAEKAVPNGTVTQLEPDKKIADFVALGFKSDAAKANEAINQTSTLLSDNTTTVSPSAWNGGKGITDSVSNTMYATFKGVGTTANYKVEFYSPSNKKLFTEPKSNKWSVTRGGVAYFSFDNSEQVTDETKKLVPGEYTAKLYNTDSTDTLLSVAHLKIYKVVFKDGTTSINGNFVMEGDTASVEFPENIKPTGGWGTGVYNDTDYTLTYTAQWDTSSGGTSGGMTSTHSVKVENAENGTVTASATSNVVKGKEVTLTVTPAEGYVLDKLTAKTDSGQIDLTKKDDTTYTFTMPAADVTVTAAFKLAEQKPEEDAVCKPYTDVDPDYAYHDQVHYMIENKLMTGVSTNTFGLNVILNRAMVAQILYSKAEPDKPSYTVTNSFSDVKNGDWFANSVTWAEKNGVTAGYGDGTFRPYNQVTREELVTMLYGEADQPDVTGDLSAYTDASSVSSWAVKPMTWAIENGVVTGTTATTLSPKNTTPRYQAAIMFYEYFTES